MRPDFAPSTLPRYLSPDGQSPAARWLAVAAFCLAAAFSAWRIAHSLHDPGASSQQPQGLIDFHHVVYFPALAFRDGVNPYSQAYEDAYPVNRRYPPYSPGMFVLNYPFALLPLEVGNVVYFVLSLVLVIALAASALYVCGIPLTLVNTFGLAALVLVSRPGHINLLLGQFTLPIVLGGVWALALARSRPGLAGVGLAIATLKPTFGVPLVWLMFCRRDFRATFSGVAIGGALAVAGIAPLVARDGWQSVVQTLRDSASLHEADPVVDPVTTWTRIDALSLICKAVPVGSPHAWEPVVAAVCLLAAGAAVWRISRSESGHGADSLSALIIFTASLACIYHSTYDALLLVVPWLGVACGRLRGELPAWSRPVLWCLLAIPAINYLSAEEVMAWLNVAGPARTALTAANSFCILAALVAAISIALRPRQTAAN